MSRLNRTHRFGWKPVAVSVTLIAVLGMLSLSQRLAGQSRSTELVGIVTDGTEAIIAGATVVVTNQDTGVRVETVTNGAGLYRITNLLPGPHEVLVTMDGFKTFRRQGLVLQLAQIARFDATLELGALTEQVTVTGEAPLLKTESAEALSQTVAQREIQTVPNFYRKWNDLIALSALTRTNSVNNGNGHDTVAFAGNRNDFGVGFFLDGGQAQDQGFTMPVNGFSTDFIQEFRLVANNFSAEFTGVQVVSATTKSGTNEFHGAANFYFQDDALNAKPWGAATKPNFRITEWGASLGGPIRKDKTHFFFGLQTDDREQNNPGILTIPKQQQIAGDFSQTFDRNGALIPVYDPSTTRPDPADPQKMTRTQFPQNIIPESAIDPVGAKILSFYPEPNLPGTITGANNYVAPHRRLEGVWQYLTRLDQQWNEKHKSLFSYIRHQYDLTNPSVYGDEDIVFSDWSHRYYAKSRVNIIRASHTWVPNANWVLETSLAHEGQTQTEADADKNWNAGIPEMLGLKGLDPTYPFPRVDISGYPRYGGTSQARHAFWPQAQQSYNQRFSNYRGRHALKFGFESERIWKNHDPQDDLTVLSFGPQPTGLPPGVANTGQSIASVILGLPMSSKINPQPERYRKMWWYGMYIDDSFKLRPNLTLNFGLRWETLTPAIFRDADGNLSLTSFDSQEINPVSGTPGALTYAGLNSDFDGVWRQYWGRWQPRFGFAWQPAGANSKTVIRGGGGIFFASVGTGGGPHYGAAVGLAKQGAWSSPDNGITFPVVLRNGFPPIVSEPPGPGFGAVQVGQSPRLDIDYVDADMLVPAYTAQYNLTVERELPWNLTLEVGYLGNLGRHLAIRQWTNQVFPGLWGPGSAQVRRPFPQYGDIRRQGTPAGTSSFHAFEFKVQKRLSNGLSFQTDWVFNKYLSDVDHWNYYDRRAGNRMQEVQHRWVTYMIYDLPWGQGRPWLQQGVLSKIIGNWTLSSFVRWQSGNFLDVTYVSNTTNGFLQGNQGVNILSNPNLSDSERTFARYFNTDAFAAPAAFSMGNAGRTMVEGPGSIATNLAFQKDTPITERFRAQFRVELFNAFNHSNWNNPGTGFGSANFGIVSQKNGNRQVQLSARLIF